MRPLSLCRLKDLLSYDPLTGIFTRLRSKKGGVNVGDVAGSDDGKGYVRIAIDRRGYAAHRLAWFYVYGEWPIGYLDHANGDPSDNRIANLRPATNSQNIANAKTPATNTSGLKGVTWNRKSGKWQSGIKVKGKSIHLGLFDDKAEAHRAYCAAATRHQGEFARAA